LLVTAVHQWVKEELQKFTQVTGPKQVKKIRLYMGISKLAETFKTFFVPTGVAAPKKSGLAKPTRIWSGQKYITLKFGTETIGNYLSAPSVGTKLCCEHNTT
jgi:hypothetical protein